MHNHLVDSYSGQADNSFGQADGNSAEEHSGEADGNSAEGDSKVGLVVVVGQDNHYSHHCPDKHSMVYQKKKIQTTINKKVLTVRLDKNFFIQMSLLKDKNRQNV